MPPFYPLLLLNNRKALAGAAHAVRIPRPDAARRKGHRRRAKRAHPEEGLGSAAAPTARWKSWRLRPGGEIKEGFQNRGNTILGVMGRDLVGSILHRGLRVRHGNTQAGPA